MARNSHGTGTPGRMNEVLGRDALGFIARQTVQTQDFREAVYAYPDGKQGHWVRNTHSETLYWVGDLTGGSTFEPGSIVFVASRSGKRGEKIIGRSPAGMVSASVATVTTPNSVGPLSAPDTGDVFGHYRGWAYFCDGGAYVWVAAFHEKYSYDPGGPTFIEGTNELRVAKIAVSSFAGAQELAVDGYEDGEFLDGTVGGTELFTYGSVPLVAFNDPDYRVVSLVEAGGTVFVVYATLAGAYTVLALTDSGTLLGSDSFSGRSIVGDSATDLLESSAVYCPDDAQFFFAHPIGSGSEEFKICRRNMLSAGIEAEVDIDFAAAGREYVGIAPLPAGNLGLRVFRSAGTGNPCEYRDYDSGLTPLTAWIAMDFGPDNELPGGRNCIVRNSTGYAVFGIDDVGDPAVFLVDHSGDFISEVAVLVDYRSPIYPASSGSLILGGPAATAEIALYRMLNDGTIA